MPSSAAAPAMLPVWRSAMIRQAPFSISGSDVAACARTQCRSVAVNGAEICSATAASCAYSSMIRSSSWVRVASAGTLIGASTSSVSLGGSSPQRTSWTRASRTAAMSSAKSRGSRFARTHTVPPIAAASASPPLGRFASLGPASMVRRRVSHSTNGRSSPRAWRCTPRATCTRSLSRRAPAQLCR